MKKTGAILIFFLLFAANGFGQSAANNTASGQNQLIPITGNIVTILNSSGIKLNDLDFYLSKSVSLIVYEQYNSSGIAVINGAIVPSEQNSALSFDFTTGNLGTYHGFGRTSGGSECFDIIFTETSGKSIILRFQRDIQHDYFIFVSAVFRNRNYALRPESERLLLAVNISNEIINDLRTGRNTIGAVQGNSQRAVPHVQTSSNNNAQPYQFLPVHSQGRSRNIEGQGSLNINGVIAYVRAKNPSAMDIELLIRTYFNEAAFEGVNHDIAVAQMLRAANFLKNEQRMADRNYAGLLSTPNNIAKFSDMTEGVRAHIQHLKGYASTAPLRNPTVDPRFDLLVSLGYSGRIRTFDQLFDVWTESPANYRNGINEILQELYRYSDNVR